MLLLRDAAQIVTPCSTQGKPLYGAAMRHLVPIPQGSLLLDGESIRWLGPTAELPPLPQDIETIDATGQVILPGLVDSHTHLIFAGSRADEFEARLSGATYGEIAARGGGINATVRQVRSASRAQLTAMARPRLRRLLAQGVTTVEVKSGYGLTLADEIKSLEAIADLQQEGPCDLVPTFLGAHAVPPEFQGQAESYLRLVGEEMLPEVVRSRLAEYCDIFCETGVFSVEQSTWLLDKACQAGLRLKVHADELTPLGGAELAVRMKAHSADHLLCVSEAGIDALAASTTVATLLPGTAFFLGMPWAPARRLLERGCAVALASDCNPGTCPTENLPLAGAMACAGMKMLPAEALTALTLNAAAALGRADRIGSLEVGKQADLILCDIPDYRHLFYHFGVNHVRCVVKRGRVVHEAGAASPG